MPDVMILRKAGSKVACLLLSQRAACRNERLLNRKQYIARIIKTVVVMFCSDGIPSIQVAW